MSSSLLNGTNVTAANETTNSILNNLGANINGQSIVEYLLFPIIASIVLSILYSVFEYVFDYLFRKGKNRNIQNYLKNLFPFNKLYGEFLKNKFKNLYNIYIYVSAGFFVSTIGIGFLMICCYMLFIYVFYIILLTNFFQLDFKESYIIFPALMNITFLIPSALYHIFIRKKIEIKEENDLTRFFNPLSKICCIIGSTLSCYYIVYFYSYYSYSKYLQLNPNMDIKNLLVNRIYLIFPYIIGMFYGHYILYILYLKLKELFIEQRKFTINKEIGKYHLNINTQFEGEIVYIPTPP